MSNETKVAERQIDGSWVWLQDYVYAWANWTINCPQDRTCQVGMGVKAFGEPRGERIRFSGYREFTSVGLGAIHVRVVDGRGPCRVRLDQGKVGLIPIYDGPAP